MSVECQVNVKSQSELDIGGRETCHIQRDASISNGTHYVDQAEWPLEDARPVSAQAGDVLVFSYLLVHGSYPNTSDR